MNITGFRICDRGLSFGNESLTAASTSSREKMLPRAPDHRLLPFTVVEGEVELEHVDAWLAQEAQAAAVSVVRDQLLHGCER